MGEKCAGKTPGLAPALAAARASFTWGHMCDDGFSASTPSSSCRQYCGCVGELGQPKENGCVSCCSYSYDGDAKVCQRSPRNVPEMFFGCDEGWSRKYNPACAEHCGCLHPDGTKKELCDLACYVQTGYCYKSPLKKAGWTLS